MMTLLALSAWLGLLCAVSPCFLAANIAAVGFLAQNCQSRRKVLLAGILYALGRVSAYVAVGALLSAGMTAAPGLSHFLQKYMTLLMGPLLVLVSLPMLDLVAVPWPDGKGRGLAGRLAAHGGALGTFLIGAVFALAFCPASAAIFFGQLMPLMFSQKAYFLPPLAFGISTALPAVLGAFLLAFSAHRLGTACKRIAAVEFWLRRLTGIAFLLIGLWITCTVTLMGR